jgi:hypothetical protein
LASLQLRTPCVASVLVLFDYDADLARHRSYCTGFPRAAGVPDMLLFSFAAQYLPVFHKEEARARTYA